MIEKNSHARPITPAAAGEATTESPHQAALLGQELLRFVAATCQPRDFTVTLWDGTTLGPESGRSSRFNFLVKDPSALETMLCRPGDLGLSEAYITNRIDVEGDFDAALQLAERLCEIFQPSNLGPTASLPTNGESANHHDALQRRRASFRGGKHSKLRDRKAIAFHYDMSNEFFALWLDSRMVYSCAYFDSPGQTLDEAQRAKIDYVCRKLRLRPGDRFLDVGCGWGALVIHACQHYGVVARGITLSRRQASVANERIRQAGLSDRCRVDICDYRELDQTPAYDKIASVGMIEHVGQSRLDDYFAQLHRVLLPGGVVLNHGIVRPVNEPCPTAPGFIGTYVFPDGELMPVSMVVRSAATAGFEPRDLESLREHYTLTLRHWLQRLENRRAEASQIVGETTYRIWRLFMGIAAYGFSAARLNVYQMLLVKPSDGKSGLPLSRADWYCAP